MLLLLCWGKHVTHVIMNQHSIQVTINQLKQPIYLNSDVVVESLIWLPPQKSKLIAVTMSFGYLLHFILNVNVNLLLP